MPILNNLKKNRTPNMGVNFPGHKLKMILCYCGHDEFKKKQEYDSPDPAPKPQTLKLSPYENVDAKTMEAAEAYKEKLMANLTPSGKKEDPNLKMTGLRCARERGSIYNVISNETNTLLYSVCFNDDTLSAIYSMHILHLQRRPDANTRRSSFMPRYTLWRIGVDSWYEAINQDTTYNTHCGPKQDVAVRNTTTENYFARNHLTPMRDFVSSTLQLLTFFFHNCFPGYQSINNGNVKYGEKQIQTISEKGKTDGLKLFVYTGVHGILTKYGKKLYLDMDEKRVEVPLVYWKLVVDPATRRHVVFLIFMNNKPTKAEIADFKATYRCNCKCKTLKYKFADRIAAGFTRCCSITELKEIAGYIDDLAIGVDPDKMLPNYVDFDDGNKKNGGDESGRKPSPGKRSGTEPTAKQKDRSSSAPPASTSGKQDKSAVKNNASRASSVPRTRRARKDSAN